MLLPDDLKGFQATNGETSSSSIGVKPLVRPTVPTVGRMWSKGVVKGAGTITVEMYR